MASGEYAGSMRRLYLAFLGLALFISVQVVGDLARPIHGDEIPVIRTVLGFGQDRTIVPVLFNYPPLYSYLQAVWIAAAAGGRWVAGGPHPVDFGFGLFWAIGGSAEFSPELAITRLLPFALAVGLVWSTYWLAGAAFGHREGIIAAVLVAGSRVLVDRAGLALPDVFTALAATLAMLFAVRYQQVADTDRSAARFRWLVLAGLLAGAAAASKYNGILAVLGPLATVLIVALSHGGQARRWATAIRDAARIGVAALIGFAVLVPGIWLAPASFWRGFRFEARHMTEGQLFVDLGELPFLWIPIRLWQVELLVGILLLVGLLVAVARWRDRVAMTLLAPVAIAVLVVGTWRYTSLHYLLWAWPCLAALAARAVTLGVARLGVRPAVGLATAIALVAPNVARSVAESWRSIRRPANVLVAERWIESRVAPGERVADDWYGVPTVWNDKLALQYRHLAARLGANLSSHRHRVIERKPVYQGALGYLIDPPSRAGLEATGPDWVMASTETEPPVPEPLRGYGSPRLAALHLRLAGFYGYLRSGGQYELVCEFAKGTGPKVSIFHRIGAGGRPVGGCGEPLLSSVLEAVP